MDALGFKQFTVFGSSDGAMVAMILASLYPDSVHKLVVWGGNAYLGEEDAKIYDTYKEITALDTNTQAQLGKVYGDLVTGGVGVNYILKMVGTFVKTTLLI